ncbi:MAG TPA: circadian clock KaiB family protein [Pyrinomonadaceae bacterium]
MAYSGGKMPNGNGRHNGNGSLKDNGHDAVAAFEQAARQQRKRPAEYILRLYVTGSSPRSLKAISNLKRVCEEHLHDDYDLQVIDIYKDPDAAREEQIIAAPTLIKRLPAPLRRFIGDLSNTQKLLVGLGINE